MVKILKIISCLIILFPIISFAKTYQSIHGFSFEISDNWILLNPNQSRKGMEEGMKYLKDGNISSKEMIEEIEEEIRQGNFDETLRHLQYPGVNLVISILESAANELLPTSPSEVQQLCDEMAEIYRKEFKIPDANTKIYRCLSMIIDGKNSVYYLVGFNEDFSLFQVMIEKSINEVIVFTLALNDEIFFELDSELNEILKSIKFQQ